MFKNIKVDIIYYKTPTDFEMEFNLSGCCRMRLLTDKAPDRKTLVNQLVRSVSRSRIIMIAGALFGEEGIIETASKAISRPLVKINNNQFSINGDDEIQIIENAIPLVSSDGIFGGCIIEQGPQTLILLSENKNIRKNIMQNLIHPYVKEVCAGELTSSEIEHTLTEPINLEEEPVPQELTKVEECHAEQVEDVSGEDEAEIEAEVEEDNSQEASDENESLQFEESLVNELIIDDDDDDLPDVVTPNPAELENSQDLVVDVTSKRIFKFKKQEKNEYKDFGNEAEAYITDDEVDTRPRLLRGINLPIILLTLLLFAVVLVLCYSIFVVPANEGISTGEYLKEIFETLFG
ncbi:MAG: hypothetical protein IJO62_04075 [Clostridia bacterium]|nr:hypothetical protein [Clostridia bacterium]